MPPVKEFLETTKRMNEIHSSKNEDYSLSTNPFSNFDVASYILDLFSNPRDQVFASLIGTKLGRLSTLLCGSKTPNNESIDDSFIDIANYFILWKCDYNKRLGDKSVTENFRE